MLIHNPIRKIDPNGDTDYFNKYGEYLGTDGIKNGKKQIAFSGSTAAEIKAATKKGLFISMNEYYYTDLVDLPSLKVQNYIEQTYTMAESIEPVILELVRKEWGGTVSEKKNGQEHIQFYPGELTHFEPSLGYEFAKDFYNATPSYDVHLHPVGMIYKSYLGDYIISKYTPSVADQNYYPEI